MGFLSVFEQVSYVSIEELGTVLDKRPLKAEKLMVLSHRIELLTLSMTDDQNSRDC